MNRLRLLTPKQPTLGVTPSPDPQRKKCGCHVVNDEGTNERRSHVLFLERLSFWEGIRWTETLPLELPKPGRADEAVEFFERAVASQFAEA